MKVSTGKIHTIMKTKNIFLTAIYLHCSSLQHVLKKK